MITANTSPATAALGIPMADAFVQRGWRCFHDEQGSAFLLDSSRGYLGQAPDSKRIVGGIDSAVLVTAAPAAHINVAWAAAVPGSPAGPSCHELQLDLLGGRILVRFTHPHCRDQVARYFSCSHDHSGSTPDVIVECDLPTADRYLFRARPAEQHGVPLDGVRVWPFGDPGPHAWLSLQPPLPPLPLAPFKDRFVALHAGVLRRPDGGGLAIVGNRNSGKSTSVLHLAQKEGFEFLADETAFIHLRTTIAEPFPQSVGVWRDGGRKEPVPADELLPRVGRRPVLIDQMLFLEPSPGFASERSAKVELLTPTQTFRSLLPHHRDASASLDEAMVTLDHIAQRVKAVRLRHRDRTELVHLLDEIIEEACRS